MNTKEIKITPPEGFEIDKENSTLECIKFKPIEKKRWRDNKDAYVKGYYISDFSNINKALKDEYKNVKDNYNIFATKKQVKSALAMARISQIMANDERFGGVVADEEWENANIGKYALDRMYKTIIKTTYWSTYAFLAFHTKEQRDLFLEENEDLVKDYLMID